MQGDASLFQGEDKERELDLELVLDQGLSRSYCFSCTSMCLRTGGGTKCPILRYPVQYCNFVHRTCTAAPSNGSLGSKFHQIVVLLQLIMCTSYLKLRCCYFSFARSTALTSCWVLIGQMRKYTGVKYCGRWSGPNRILTPDLDVSEWADHFVFS